MIARLAEQLEPQTPLEKLLRKIADVLAGTPVSAARIYVRCPSCRLFVLTRRPIVAGPVQYGQDHLRVVVLEHHRLAPSWVCSLSERKLILEVDRLEIREERSS